MTLRIRELVIRAEIGGNADTGENRKKKGSPPATASKSEVGIMTRRFYEKGTIKDNER